MSQVEAGNGEYKMSEEGVWMSSNREWRAIIIQLKTKLERRATNAFYYNQITTF